MASSAFDAFNLQRSMAGPDRPTWDLKDKQYVEITDTNNLNYSGGNINFDCNGFVSNVAMTDWQSSYMIIPLTLKMTLENPSPNGSDLTFHAEAAVNKFAAQLKSGYFQIINGITCTVANQTVVSLQQMSNIPMYFKLLTSWNEMDQHVMGPTMGFWKDTAGSVKYDAVFGETNNNLVPSVPTIVRPQPYNEGAYKRHNSTITGMHGNQIQVGNNLVTATNLMTEAAFGTNRKNKFTRVSETELKYEIFAYIPMPVFHDLFAKIPYQRGALWQMTVHTHLGPCTHTCNLSHSAAGALVVESLATTTNNGFCPFATAIPNFSTGAQLEPATPYSTALCLTSSNLAAASKKYDLKTSLTIGNSNLASCVLNVCQVELSPDKLSAYMADNVKPIVFEDFITCRPSQLQAISPGQAGRSQITAGLPKLRWMLIVPNLPAGANTATLSALNSPYSTCGATTAPWSFMDQLNVSLGSKNIWDRHSRYTYDQFVRQILGINATNGNALPGLRAGLINEMEWRAHYGYVYISLERHLESADALSSSIDIEFVNTSTKTMAYTVYVGFEKEFALDCVTGKIII